MVWITPARRSARERGDKGGSTADGMAGRSGTAVGGTPGRSGTAVGGMLGRSDPIAGGSVGTARLAVARCLDGAGTVFGVGATTGACDGGTRSAGRWAGATAGPATDGAGATAAAVLGRAADGADGTVGAGADATGGGASATPGDALDSLAVGGASGALDGRNVQASTTTLRASRPPTTIHGMRHERATPG
jgi:hypothetical protein